jgi:hypothetical protein
MTTIQVTHTEGAKPSGYSGTCAAGENLAIRVSLFAADGVTPRDLTGKLVVLGWSAPSGEPANRHEETAVAGVATFAFAASQTQVLEGETSKFDVWVESLDGNTRERVVGVSVVAFDEGIAPPEEHSVYYGVGASGFTSVAALTAANETSLDLTFTVSPSHQKVYFAWETTLGTPVIMHDGFELDALAATSITVNGVLFSLIESTNYLTGSGIAFVVTEAP